MIDFKLENLNKLTFNVLTPDQITSEYINVKGFYRVAKDIRSGKLVILHLFAEVFTRVASNIQPISARGLNKHSAQAYNIILFRSLEEANFFSTRIVAHKIVDPGYDLSNYEPVIKESKVLLYNDRF